MLSWNLPSRQYDTLHVHNHGLVGSWVRERRTEIIYQIAASSKAKTCHAGPEDSLYTHLVVGRELSHAWPYSLNLVKLSQLKRPSREHDWQI